MKRYLILGVFGLGALGVVAAPPVPRTPREVKPGNVQPRHLSDAERAELRRQLEEYNREHRRRS